MIRRLAITRVGATALVQSNAQSATLKMSAKQACEELTYAVGIQIAIWGRPLGT
jgi:hypothetical protein